MECLRLRVGRLEYEEDSTDFLKAGATIASVVSDVAAATTVGCASDASTVLERTGHDCLCPFCYLGESSTAILRICSFG
jgi:hypothetical protein